jgi:hypothetical protein
LLVVRICCTSGLCVDCHGRRNRGESVPGRVVGEAYYPNVADMVEEIRNQGLSRRLPKSIDFSKLTSASRIILAHPRAVLANWRELLGVTCAKGQTHDEAFAGTCVGAWYADVVEGGPEGSDPGAPVVRAMPGGFSYHGRQRDPVARVGLGIFASFPIGNLAVIREAEGGSHVGALDAARASSLPVNLEDE